MYFKKHIVKIIKMLEVTNANFMEKVQKDTY